MTLKLKLEVRIMRYLAAGTIQVQCVCVTRLLTRITSSYVASSDMTSITQQLRIFGDVGARPLPHRRAHTTFLAGNFSPRCKHSAIALTVQHARPGIEGDQPPCCKGTVHAGIASSQCTY